MDIDMVVFDQLPIHDTCWSMTTGADGAIYAAACCEHTGGVGAWLVRYDPATDTLDYLFDIADAVGEPADNGRATQCKVHYSLLPTADGLIYGTTHLSGPPLGDVVYPAWGAWRHPKKSYRGAMFFVYDINSREIVDRGLMVPEEGSRAQALDIDRRRIYVVGYPRNHFMIYDIDRRILRDYGRIGSVNPQAIWLDTVGNAYTTDDFGNVLKFDVAEDRLTDTGLRLPFPSWQNGWHTVVYDVVAGDNPDVVYGVSWNVFPHLFRHVMSAGRIDDLGPAHPEYTGFERTCVTKHHVGGMVFGDDGLLYYGVNRLSDAERSTHLVRMDVQTGEQEDLGQLVSGEHEVMYLARGMRAGNGDLVFGAACCVPARLYRHRMNSTGANTARLRIWG